MYSCLRGKGLIAFSDPAGAKACLGLAQILTSNYKNEQLLLLSNKNYSFYSEWSIPIIVSNSFNRDFISVKPDWIFTGTSHPESSGRFELAVLEYAREKNIPSFSFVDHWTSILLRFHNGSGHLFPNHVIVVDEKARRLAIEEGVPPEIISIYNNPYLDFIRTLWQPDQSEQILLHEFQKKNNVKRAILYAPDPFSLRGEEFLWGFNESTALRDLMNVTRDTDFSILVKKHPLQPENLLENVVAGFTDKCPPVYFVSEFKNLDLMYFADLIVGFHSNFLLEANALGKKIIRYFPESSCKEPLNHLNIGTVATTKQELARLIS